MGNKIINQNDFSLRRHQTETILFQRMENCRNYFRSLLQLVNTFQHIQCRWNNREMVSAAEIILYRFQMWLRAKQNSLE